MKIRPYTPEDFEVVKSWWGQELPREVYPLESTFVAECDGLPRLVVAIYYTNCPLVAFMEGFCGDPEFRGEKRKELGQTLLTHCESVAREKGFKRLIGQSANPKLTKRWQELGFVMQVEQMSSLVKEI